MLAATVTAESEVWFFKALGPAEGVEQIREGFHELLASLRFDAGSPVWKLPEGWNESRQGGLRFATLDPGVAGIDISVIALPAPQDTLANVNRWREQLQLPPVSAPELDAAVTTIEGDGVTANLVDLVGTASAATAPPRFGASAGPVESTPPASTTPPRDDKAGAGASSGVTYSLPARWQPGRPSVMRRLSFAVIDGEKSADISVSTLPLRGADPLMNVNRWRGELGLDPIEQPQLESERQTLRVAGDAADYFHMEGEAPDGARRATLAVILPREDEAWFFKMMGEASLVAAEKDKFAAFVESVQFSN